MTCVKCGLQNPNVELCPHHLAVEVHWAAMNRIFCNALHRGIMPARVQDSFEPGMSPVTS